MTLEEWWMQEDILRDKQRLCTEAQVPITYAYVSYETLLAVLGILAQLRGAFMTFQK